MNALDQLLFDMERVLGSSLPKEAMQDSVMAAKMDLMLSTTRDVMFTVGMGDIEAKMTKGIDWSKSFEKVDLEQALVYLIRAYRLKKGIREQH